MTDDVLQRLAALIRSRRGESAGKSYTRELLDAGPQRCAKKLGEEATETVIAALGSDNARADARGGRPRLSPARAAGEPRAASGRCLDELESRMGTSGLAEKAARETAAP